MTKIGSGVNKMSIKRKQVILNKVRCKIMDSRRRKKKTETKPHEEKKGGILKYLKNVIMHVKNQMHVTQKKMRQTILKESTVRQKYHWQ